MNSNIKSFEIDQTNISDWVYELDGNSIELLNLMNKELIPEETDSDDDKGDSLLTRSESFESNDKNIFNETVEVAEEISNITVEDIIACDQTKMLSIDIIKYECSLAYFIQVLMEGSNINRIKTTKNYDIKLSVDNMLDIISYLKWISKSSKILAERIGQELYHVKADDNLQIVRSSYNFCNSYLQCKKFYSRTEEPTCTEHHYVHSLLKYDTDSVINFMNHMISNDLELNSENLNSLYLSIKTICYITRHMAKEISYIDHFTKKNSELFHKNNPFNNFKKKSVVQNKQNVSRLNHTRNNSRQCNMSEKNTNSRMPKKSNYQNNHTHHNRYHALDV